jgi:hypothetical protein
MFSATKGEEWSLKERKVMMIGKDKRQVEIKENKKMDKEEEELRMMEEE